MNHKKKTVAALLAFFFGAFGVHRFYLGQIGRGILYIFIPFISWIIAIIDALIFATMDQEEFDRKYNPYLFMRRDGESYNNQYQARNAPPNQSRYGQQQQRDEHQQVLDTVAKTRNEIIALIEHSKDYSNDIVTDIKSMLNSYSSQIEQLTVRDKKLQKVAGSYNISELDSTITGLKRKMDDTQNVVLKDEYERSISKYLAHRKSFQDLKEQREIIRLRINSSMMSLKQIKLDMLKMENMATYEQREMFFKTFEEKSKDLTNYLEFLEQSYSEGTSSSIDDTTRFDV